MNNIRILKAARTKLLHKQPKSIEEFEIIQDKLLYIDTEIAYIDSLNKL